MKGDTLTLKDLKGGDVLLVEDIKDGTHKMIAVGQAVFSHRTRASSNVTHAGLFDGCDSILESSGAVGLRAANFFKDHLGTKYQVYRFDGLPLTLADCARDWAELLVEHRPWNLKTELEKGEGFGAYSKPKALHSLFSRSNRGKGAKSAVANLRNDPLAERDFYCSNFVVECYELACTQKGVNPVIEVDYRNVSPKRLQSALRHDPDWEHVGNFTIE